jgi:hypothetical protein
MHTLQWTTLQWTTLVNITVYSDWLELTSLCVTHSSSTPSLSLSHTHTPDWITMAVILIAVAVFMGN